MSDWLLVSSICTERVCHMVYRSPDGTVGVEMRAGGSKPARRQYFAWGRDTDAPAYATEAEARAAITQEMASK